MKKILNSLFAHRKLDRLQAREVLVNIAEGKYNEAQIAAFMTVYLMRSITVDELTGFRDALLDLCIKTDLSEFDPIDLCGTGGDGKDTFNISTLASFVTAGAGANVAKHGNYGVSSICGSSNVLEHFGAVFTNDRDKLRRQMEASGFCMMHAPLFHPAMKTVGPIRRMLGIKTFFNMLGPMVNPAFPKKQLTGVFNLELARLYAYISQADEGKRFAVLHSLDGYDEISLTGPFKLIDNEGDKLFEPTDLGMKTLRQDELYGGKTVDDAANLFRGILENKGTEAQNNAVTANAAVALRCYFPEKDMKTCLHEASESLKSGRALHSFKKFLETSAA